MNPSLLVVVVLFLMSSVSALFSASPAVATAPLVCQEEEDAYEVRAYRLQSADPHTVIDQIQALLEPDFYSCVTDERTNQIFLRARPETLDTVAGLIEKLDIRVRDRRTLQTEIISPTYRSAKDFSGVIKLHLSKDGQLVIDEDRNMAVVRDTPEVIEAAREVVAKLDQPVLDLQLQFMILGPSSQPLPETAQMARVAEELKGLGLVGYGVICRAGVVTQENSQFSVNGVNASGTLMVTGRIHLLPREDKVALALDMGLNGPNGEAEVSTKVKMPLNHVVILGVAPAGGEPGQPLILVTQARRI